ncbi:bifunctional protein-serine/threonine kinase/phosphatase [Pseudoalteromonas sp. SWXJ133]|uniref:bifunctional protein-serine/threonine kinase/phosphatase n=1 Tax=unclassified Pseudoalteromonas TaxID=194690 RepID=UPI00140CA9B6|nr:MULTISPECIES: bifunctional protein-serine/threonine kinase/phosphatase [unclassified Pseudoalteromonas]MBH0020875.1 bifunctional protein-serine/threonine kinase/phosphatase [Pseudoalteromonas sp. SWXJ133]
MFDETLHAKALKNELNVSFGGHSAKGLKAENQDAFAALNTKAQEKESKGVIACLADGCSSAKNAKQASQLSVTHFINEYLNTPESWAVKKSVSKVLASLNQWLYSQSVNYNHLGQRQADWMTTFTALILKSATGYIFHLGDTRITRLRGNKIEAITRDHKVNDTLTRALGAQLHQEIDVYEVDLKADDIYILTCDGVHDVLPNSDIAKLINEHVNLERTNLENAAKAITELALARGSDDNVSCLLVKVENIAEQKLDELYHSLTRRKIPPALNVGQKIDDYTVIRKLHASSRSHIYLVQQAPDIPPVVLKAPSVNFEDDVHYLQGFIREGWVGQRINHLNVMKVLSTQSQSRFLYHICEYMDGQTLSDWKHDVPHPEITQVRSIIEQIVHALRAFQRLDMVHRDLKLDNVMIDAHGKVTLIDYGTVSVAAMDESVKQIADDCPQGTADYTAPETLITMHADFKSDLFSLGVIAYELLCSKLPYKPLPLNHVAPKDYSHWHYTSIRKYRADIPFWLDQALMKALAPKPELRYQAFSEFINDINKPNPYLESTANKSSIMKRDPVMVWKCISLCLFIALVCVLIIKT